MEKFNTCAAAALREPSDLKVSPDGKYVAYSREVLDYENDCRGSDIFVLDLECGKERQLTFDGVSGGARWLDERNILFQSERKDEKMESDGGTCFYSISLDGGKAEKALRLPLTAIELLQLDKGCQLVLALENDAPEDWQQQGQWRMIGEYPYRSNGRGYIDGMYGKLYIFNERDETSTPITDESKNVTRILLTDDTAVYYAAGDRTEALRAFHQPVYRTDLNTGETICIFCRENYAVSDMVFFSGRLWMALMTDGPDVQLSCFDMASMLPDGSDFRIEHSLQWFLGGIAVQEKALYTVRGWQAQMRLYRGSAFNESDNCLTKGDLDVCELCCENGEVVFTGRSGNGLREIYRLQNEKAVRLTDRSRAFLQRYRLSTPKLMHAAAEDGVKIPFWIMEPTAGGRENRPAVLSIHGGPDGLYDGYLNPLHQAYAAAGYYVIFCNPRGSLTYGRDFMKIEGGSGAQDYEDLMRCVDMALAETPGIDEKRLYVTGSSYGGYMTNWIICHTDRFSAAAPRVSVSNWISLRGTGDYKELCDWMHGVTPWEDVEGLWNRSPLRWADRVKTPTLFVQHGEDYRCPLEQAEQMYAALAERGIEARMLINEGASHFVMSPKQEKHTFEQIVQWFDRHKRGE